MADVVEIIDYIKTLRKGFDKDLFQSKIDELANAVDTTGLVYEDFHTLFQVWLHLSLPISKWVNMGSCLAPPDIVERKTVQYALRWILAHAHDQTSSARLGFLLDWLTVAMDCESIDMKTLDSGYDIFYNLLTFEAMTVHAAKLVYTLTKPTDVTRKKVIQLLEYASKREASKSLLKQLQVILGLFKSYKPDCVPEDIPAFPIYTAFKKRNENLYTRFKKLQNRRHKFSAKKQHLVWINPINSEKGRTKKAEPLVPNLEFINLHKKGDNGEPTNNFFDFSEPAALLQASALGGVARPARLRALLCNGMGHTLLALQPHAQHAFLEHDLRALLFGCFMEPSPYSYAEKADLLQKLVELQRTLLQGVPAVTYFLAHYLPFWNEADYFPQILDLCEWVSAQPEEVSQIAGALAAACLRAPRLRQAALLRSLSHMYSNLVYASTKSRQHFLPESPPEPANYGVIIPALAQSIATLCHKLLQVDPGCVFTLHMVTWSALHRARGERAAGAALGALPSRLALALPLLSASPVLIDNMAELIILYKKIMTNTKAEPSQVEYISKYLQDLLNCLYSEEALSGRHNGLVFQDLNPQLVDKLRSLMPDVDSKLSLRNHIAFSPLTYLRLLDVNNKDADNKMLFHGVLQSEFPHLGLLLKKTLPELRHH